MSWVADRVDWMVTEVAYRDVRWDLDRMPTEAELFERAGVSADDIPPESGSAQTGAA